MFCQYYGSPLELTVELVCGSGKFSTDHSITVLLNYTFT